MELELQLSPPQKDWIAVGFVAGVSRQDVETSANKARGFHGKDMLIILEETPGIAQAVINAFEDTCGAPHNLILAFGNPDHQLDSLHRFCSLPRVTHIRASALDHPNVVLDNPDFIPGAITRSGISEKKQRYGDGSPLEQSRNRGISPAQSADSLIRLEWCHAAAQRELKPEEGPMVLGVDVANSIDGDKASIARGHYPVLEGIESGQCPNANQLGHRIGREVGKDIYTVIAVDGIGVGAGTVNVLRDDYRLTVDPLTGGPVETPNAIDSFNSLRSQMWWEMRIALEQKKIKLPNDPELFSDLVTPKWEVRSGKICVEAKVDLKKRLGRSPDKGDAAVYWNWAASHRGASSAEIASVPRQESMTAKLTKDF